MSVCSDTAAFLSCQKLPGCSRGSRHPGPCCGDLAAFPTGYSPVCWLVVFQLALYKKTWDTWKEKIPDEKQHGLSCCCASLLWCLRAELPWNEGGFLQFQTVVLNVCSKITCIRKGSFVALAIKKLRVFVAHRKWCTGRQACPLW